MKKEAMFYEKLDRGNVRCLLCAHKCRILPERYGLCCVRQNLEGILYTHVYAEVVAQNVDPIEKKPIFHMLPGSKSFSVATRGCNFKCNFCQNWQISQAAEVKNHRLITDELEPSHLVELAKKYRCQSISYTYTEPTVFFEYAYDTAKIAKKQGLYNIFVTNGYMTEEMLDVSSPYLDACNVDLKSFSDDYYRRFCSARLEPVLNSIKKMKALNIWVEVTTLIIPGMNDTKGELRKIASFIATLDKNIPWHVSRFHPDYKMTNVSATPMSTLEMAFALGKESGLSYVYLGNVVGEENTYCKKCQELLIKRESFSVLENKLVENRCPRCGTVLDGKALVTSDKG